MYKIFFYALSLFLTLAPLTAQEWEAATAPPEEFRSHHTFGFALDGKGYLVSGATPTEYSDNMYEYNPETESWTELDPFPGEARSFAIGDTHDGKAYFGFGATYSSYLNDLWVYDGETWTELTSCPCAARTHPSFTAADDKIYVAFGNNGSGNLRDAWEYDIDSDTWQQLPDMPSAARHHPFQFTISDVPYIGMGHGNNDIFSDMYYYNKENNSWESTSDLPDQGRVAGAQFEYNNKGYVLSGEGQDHGPMDEGEFWEYDSSTDEWKQLPSHPGQSRWAPATFIIDSMLYLINGTIRGFGIDYQDEAWKFNLSNLISTEVKEIKQSYTLYPNPTSEKINFQFPANVTLNKTEIYSLDGTRKRVFNNGNTINISSLQPGVYLAVLYTNEGRFTEKVVVR